MEDLNLGDELILDAGCRVSLHGSLLTFHESLSLAAHPIVSGGR